MRKHHMLVIIFLGVLLAIATTLIGYITPKAQVLQFSSSYTGYYRGYGFHEESGFLGKNWFRIKVDEGDYGYWEVDVNGVGYSSYRGFYPSGILREEGQCMVENNGSDIVAYREDVLNGIYYDPAGNMVSEVIQGTGTQLLFDAKGNLYWELQLVDRKYSLVRMWHENGNLIHESRYQNGKQHGEAKGYYDNGQLKYQGWYANGRKRGAWKEFDEDGSLLSQSDEGDE